MRLLTDKARVLAYFDAHPRSTTRRAGESLGITERAVQRHIATLEAEGMLQRRRVGRNNQYATTCSAALVAHLHQIGDR